jgi:hypothetical protein
LLERCEKNQRKIRWEMTCPHSVTICEVNIQALKTSGASGRQSKELWGGIDYMKFHIFHTYL